MTLAEAIVRAKAGEQDGFICLFWHTVPHVWLAAAMLGCSKPGEAVVQIYRGCNGIVGLFALPQRSARMDWHTGICGFVAAGGERGDGNPIAVRCCAGGIFVDGQAPPIGTACAARFVRRGMLCAAGVGDSLSARRLKSNERCGGRVSSSRNR